jgi:hypothetical protein
MFPHFFTQFQIKDIVLVEPEADWAGPTSANKSINPLADQFWLFYFIFIFLLTTYHSP